MGISALQNQEQKSVSARSDGGLFEIRVKGHLDGHWTEWLGDLDMELRDNGEMVLSGTIIDQAALMGLFGKLYRLNLAILSVNRKTN